MNNIRPKFHGWFPSATMEAAAQRELGQAVSDGDIDAFRRLYEQHPQYRVRVFKCKRWRAKANELNVQFNILRTTRGGRCCTWPSSTTSSML